MPFSEEAKAEIRQIFDEQLAAFLRYSLKAFEPAEPRPTPAPTQMQPAPLMTASINSLEICPKCGGKKKPDFKICYKCHLEETKAT
jgi:hypothetical protein